MSLIYTGLVKLRMRPIPCGFGRHSEVKPLSTNSCMTNAQADAAAAVLGYTRVANEYSHGSPIYYNKKGNPRYITPDNLASKETRSGTYDAELNKIGP